MRGCPMRPDRENRATEHAARWWLAVLVLATFEALLLVDVLRMHAGLPSMLLPGTEPKIILDG